MLRTRIINGRMTITPATATRAHPRGRNYERLRQAAATRDNWICQHCGQPIDPWRRKPDPLALHGHHIIEVAAGGNDTLDNLAAMHADCHLKRD